MGAAIRWEHFDVIVIGYGLVGNVAALLLAKQGLRVAVVERAHLSDLGIAKAGRIDSETMRIMEQLQLREELERIMHPLRGVQIMDKGERVVVPVEQPKEIGGGDYAQMYAFYQPELQEILQKAAQRQRIRIYAPFEVLELEQDDEAVRLRAQAPAGEECWLQAQFLVVCSGARNIIAQECNLGYLDYGYSGYTLNVETESQKPLPTPPFAQTIYDLPIPVTRITHHAQRQRWEFQLTAAQVNAANTPEALRRLISELCPVDFEVLTVLLHEFDTRSLRQWHKERIFFAGDAAHTMPPYLGMGLSAGIKDVHNLAWKIALVLRGISDKKIFASYKGERLSNITQLIQLNMWIKRLFSSSRLRFLRFFLPFIPKFLLRRRLDLSTQIQQGIIGKRHKQRGRFLPNFRIATADNLQESESIDKHLGQNFAIIAYNLNPVDATPARHIERLAQLGCVFLQIVPPPTAKPPTDSLPRYTSRLIDLKGEFRAWTQQHRCQFLILRPDRFLYDSAANWRELTPVLDELMQALHLQALRQPKAYDPEDNEAVHDFLDEDED